MKTARQCKGTTKHGPNAGNRCKRPALMGQRVCYRHGGNTQAALRAARMRMLAACEPAIVVLLKVVGNDRAADSDRITAAKAILDRGGMAPGLDISAVIEHRVPGWEAVVNGMFAAQQPAAIEAGPSLSDLTDAYSECGYTDPETCRNHACRILAREIDSSHELSSADIRVLLNDLRPDGRYADVIEAEVVPEDRSNPPQPGARMGKAVRVEPTSDALPRYVTDRERAGSARTYGRYN